jgi:hypothetical protein
MIPAIYNLPDAYRGDSYGPIRFVFTNPSGAPYNLSGLRASLQFRNKKTTEVVADWDSDYGSMFVSGNTVTMNRKPGEEMEIPALLYGYDLQLMSGTLVRTYIRGDVQVYQDVTDVTQ